MAGMPSLELPAPLRELLQNSPPEPAVLRLLAAVRTILTDNDTPFFPAYTDHGVEHVSRVMETAVRLVPEDVWSRKLLDASDAAVLVGASLLHDLALHLREPGFLQLVSGESSFTPRPWFATDQPGRPADRPWQELWREFQREARHFGISELELILGAGTTQVPAVAFQADLESAGWTTADHLLVGEFLRRHHARLAHEIAIYGFPGSDDTFPALLEDLPNLAEAIGVVARSHNEPLRRMVEYLEHEHPGSQRPSGSVLVYDMALLRIADYLQLEADRAPTILLRLKSPQSPASVAEWNKHAAVAAIVWDHRDPLAIYIEVASKHPLRTHLALGTLLEDLQREFDASAAVLSEVYPYAAVSRLRLARQYVKTNLHEPSLHSRLPYVPRRAALRSDQDLFRLVIGQLYGDEPAVAGRELLQNAVDAVRARRLWESRMGVVATDLYRQDADVVVAVVDKGQAPHALRVTDRGIGMTPDVITKFFLQAGASFGPTVGPQHHSGPEALENIKLGRFGVGAFAAFLLGPELRVTSRHVSADRGVTFVARIDEDLVEMRWANDVPVGTEVVVPFEMHAAPPDFIGGDDDNDRETFLLLESIAEYFRLGDPVVAFEFHRDGRTTRVPANTDVPAPLARVIEPWRRLVVEDFDEVYWRIPANVRRRHSDHGRVIHNGMVLTSPEHVWGGGGQAYSWTDNALKDFVSEPDVAVFDTRHRLGVSLDRYGLQKSVLPFERELLRSVGVDIVAHALAGGIDKAYPLAREPGLLPVLTSQSWLPLLPGLLSRLDASRLLVLWRIDEQRPWKVWPEVRSFASPGRSAGWERFPYRVTLPLDVSYRDDSDAEWAEELDAWGYGLADVERAVDHWRRALAGEHLGTVVVRGTSRRGAPWTSLLVDTGTEWRVEGGPQRVDSGTFVYGEHAPWPEVESALTEVAGALCPNRGDASIALSVFGEFAPGGAGHASVAEPWMELIGRGLARGSRELAEESNEILHRHKVLRGPVEQWRRLLNDV